MKAPFKTFVRLAAVSPLALDLYGCGMVLEKNGEIVATGNLDDYDPSRVRNLASSAEEYFGYPITAFGIIRKTICGGVELDSTQLMRAEWNHAEQRWGEY